MGRLRITVVEEFAFFWMILGAAISLILMLGIALLIAILQISTLNKEHVELNDRNQNLSELQQSQAKDIRELRSGLRAEKAHVEQLQRKAHLIESLLGELQTQQRGK